MANEKLSPVVMDLGAIQNLAEELLERIKERFPKSAMTSRAGQLVTVSREIERNIGWMKRGSVLLWSIPLLFLVNLGLYGWIYYPNIKLKLGVDSVSALVNLLSDSSQAAALIGAGLGYLFFSSQRKFKREKTFKVAGKLENFCHVINLGQLDKDPARLYRSAGDNTKKSLELNMSPLQLECYLDYCSEMLSLLGAIAAYYKQSLSDDPGREAFAEVEVTAGGFSTKIWQKETILTAYRTSGTQPTELSVLNKPENPVIAS